VAHPSLAGRSFRNIPRIDPFVGHRRESLRDGAIETSDPRYRLGRGVIHPPIGWISGAQFDCPGKQTYVWTARGLFRRKITR